MDIKRILDEEYNKLGENYSDRVKFDVLNNIIQIKKANTEYKDYQRSLYQDFKKFIHFNIKLADSADYRYDNLKIESFENLAKKLYKNKQVNLIDFYIRKLERSSFRREIKKLQSLRYKTIVSTSIREMYKPLALSRIIFYAPLINIYSLIISFLIIAFFSILATLKAPIQDIAIFNFHIIYEDISNYYFLNHAINILTNLVGLSSKFKIVGKDLFSQITLICGKIFSVIFITSILFNKLTDFLRR